MGIFSQKSEAFGLDISTRSLKLVKLEKSRDGLMLVSFGEAKVPPGVVEECKVKDTRALSNIIKKALRQVQGKKLKTKYVVVSLPEERSFLDVLQLPFVKEEELESTVRFEAENHIPVSLDEVYFDFEKIPSIQQKPKYQEVLIAAIPKDIVESYLKALKGANLFPQAVEIECSAVARALVKKDTVQKPLLLIDFGETRTSFIIFSGKSLRFTSTIPVSSGGLTEAISRSLGANLKRAEKLKLQEGLQGKKDVFEAMVPALTDLAEQIKTHLEYYCSHVPQTQVLQNGKRLEKILLCGGGANLKGLPDFLSSTLNIEVQLANPLVNISKKTVKGAPKFKAEKALGYTTALGLALRGIYGY